MGVKTPISLDELNRVFGSYGFTKLTHTASGIIDTTYIAHTKNTEYILKRYEREIPLEVARDIELLSKLKSAGLNVPICLDEKEGWYLYEKLNGSEPRSVKSFHIQALGRFLAKLHKETSKESCDSDARIKDEVLSALLYAKRSFFCYYKRFEFLKRASHKNEALIHGDIFKDNTVFDGTKLGVFDFIDSSCGSFAFDAAVALVGFDVKADNNCYINLFLRCYNQKAPKKLQKREIVKAMKTASHFYALKRLHGYKNTKRAKELIRYY